MACSNNLSAGNLQPAGTPVLPYRGYGLYLPCTIAHVRDADTIVIMLPGGYRRWPIRIKNINAPERDESLTEQVRDYLSKVNWAAVWIAAPHNPINILRDIVSFDRILGDIFVNHQNGDNDWFSNILLAKGWAEPW